MRKHMSRFIGGVLLAFVLAACGQSAQTDSAGGEMAGMDPNTMPGMAGMDPSTMPGMASNAPYDAQFIDSMIEHHTSAITMAKQALKESQRPEIKQLAQNIIATQQQAIDQMTAWRKQWYPDLKPTNGMGMDMGDMQLSTDTSKPFDQRFIAAMVAHHNGAIAMAKDAQTKAERPEIQQLAAAIIKAQEAEVAQLQQWNRQWFGA